MSKKCWKPVKFADVKRYGKQELLMANSGIDVKIVIKTKQRQMGDLSFYDVLCKVTGFEELRDL